MSGLPERLPAPDLVESARQCAEAVAKGLMLEAVRFERVTMLIAQSRHEWRGTEEEIAAAAGYNGMGEYWSTAFAEPLRSSAFAHLIALHVTNPRESVMAHSVRSMANWRLDAALRRAREAGEPWFIERSDNREPLVRPRAAAEWLASKPRWRDLLPISLRVYLDRKPSTEIVRTGAPGRPTSMNLIEAELRRRADAGEMLPKLAREADALAAWLPSAHPAAPKLKAKSISNRLRKMYRELAGERPKL